MRERLIEGGEGECEGGREGEGETARGGEGECEGGREGVIPSCGVLLALSCLFKRLSVSLKLYFFFSPLSPSLPPSHPSLWAQLTLSLTP